jgi:DNA-binding response OmpR family regulator
VTPGTKVLIVEDDPQMVRFLRATLSAHELVVAVAEGVAAGATAAAADPPDVVLLDLGLPDGDGLELVRRCGRGPRCRSSCCRRAAARTTRWPPSTLAPTTT